MPSPKTQTELTAEQSRNFWQGARFAKREPDDEY